MKTLLVLALLAAPASAAPADAIVRDALAQQLPAGLGVVAVHLPTSLAAADLDPAAVSVVVPRALHAGRPSIKVVVPGKASVWVPVSIAQVATVAVLAHAVPAGATLTDADITVEERAVAPGASPDHVIGARATHALAAGAVVRTDDIALPPPLARDTEVTIEIRRGNLRVHGSGKLELAARPGEPATARVLATHQLVHGTLIAPSTVLVGGNP